MPRTRPPRNGAPIRSDALSSASETKPSSTAYAHDPSAHLLRSGRAASMNSLLHLASASSGGTA